ncbi:nucleotide sugar dehydrogenase, partial [Actinomyces sp. S6-Spd3]
MRTNDRIVGGTTPEATERAAEVYRSCCTGEILLTDARTAEMSKLAENAYRDVNIAYANELSLICDEQGIDVWELIEIANRHPRVNILQPGPGVGGHCIAVDPWFIVAATPTAKLIKQAREINDAKPDWVISKIDEAVKSRGGSAAIGLLGLAFKPNIDDLRESPALGIATRVAAEYPDARIMVVEPNIDSLPRQLQEYPNVEFTEAKQVIDEA